MDNKPSNDVGKLSEVIKLDPKPQSAQWAILQEDGSSFLPSIDSVLVAVLHYSSADFAAASATAAAGGKPDGGYLRLTPDWLPAEIKALSQPAPNDGIDFGGKALSAEAYFSSPYSAGFAVAIPASNIVLVCLYSM